MAAEEEIAKIFPIELERFFFIDGEEVEAYTDDEILSDRDHRRHQIDPPSSFLNTGYRGFESHSRRLRQRHPSERPKAGTGCSGQRQSRQLFGQLSAVRKQISELEKEVERLNERKSGLEDEMSKHEELRLYAEEKLVIQAQMDMLENTLQTSLQTLISIQRSRKRAFWGLLGPQYEVIQEENDANQSRRFELDSKQRERSNLQSTIEAFTSICESCGQKVPDAEAHLSKKKQELAALEAAIQTLESKGGTDPRVLRQKLTAMEKHFMPNAGSKERIVRAYAHYKDQVTEFENPPSVEQILRNSSRMTVRKKFKHLRPRLQRPTKFSSRRKRN